MIVPVPVMFVRFTLTVLEPSLTIVSESGAFSTQGCGSGVGVGVAVGVGVGVGVALGSGVGVGVALGSGVGVGVALGSGVGVGVALGSGVGVGVGVSTGAGGSGDAPGSGVTGPPGTVGGEVGIKRSKNHSVSNVTSPDPVIFMFTWFVPLSNPNDSSLVMRPRQSNTMVFIVVNLTPCSRSKFRVLTAPNPSQSIVMA